MTTIESAETRIRAPGGEYEVHEVQLAAVPFLARYSGRTLEAYRQDLRGFFQWAASSPSRWSRTCHPTTSAPISAQMERT